MKVEIEIDEALLAKQARSLAEAGVKSHLLGEYNRITDAGKRIRDLAAMKAAEVVASGEVRELIAAAAREEVANVVKELTVAELRKAVRAELKVLREKGQLKLE